MKYLITYESTPTTTISFMLSDENLQPSVITDALGIKPDESWSKGDPIDLKTKSFVQDPHRVYTFGRWTLNAPCSPYDEFEEQLDKLIARVEALPPVIKEYIELFDGGFVVAHSSGDVSIGFNLSPQIIQRMAALNLSIVFDIYPVTLENGSE